MVEQGFADSTFNRGGGVTGCTTPLRLFDREPYPMIISERARSQFPILEEQLPLSSQIPLDWSVGKILKVIAEAAAFSLWKKYQPPGVASDGEKPKVALIIGSLDCDSLPSADFEVSFAGVNYCGRLYAPDSIDWVGEERAGLPDFVSLDGGIADLPGNPALGLEDFFFNGQLTEAGGELVDYLELKIQEWSLGPLFAATEK